MRIHKSLFFCVIIFLFFSPLDIVAQTTTPLQTKQYATVTMRVYYQGNNVIYDDKGLAQSPILSMPDGNLYILTDLKGEITKVPKGKFKEPTQVLNYMASYGWTLASSTVLPYEGGSGNTSTSSLLNTNQYMQVLIFEMPFSKP